MKNLKVTFVSFFASLTLLMFALPAVAQPGGGGRDMDPEARAEQQAKRMQQDLELSDEQYQEVKAINLMAAKDMQETRQNNEGDREAMRAAMQQIRTETEAQFQAILSPEQWTKFETMQAERQEERKEGQQGRAPRGRKSEKKAKADGQEG